ncbi:uncharacterized protein A4U43_C01F22540 [Asparagus officinalis]|uniref:Pectate lyase n=1 Tax=Asparagus officinalis TaxID=4686 RepID=A0A5P1FTV3_ASPOF|nr:pectate lyase-like [Asparagus officinalis]ONK80857.1 uncharacterized protein A4U43_C01F22540 [Asparagus officinalis]
MECSRPITLLFLVPFLTLALASKSAHKETDEEYWKRREHEAQVIAKATYVPDPFSVTNAFNAAVRKDLDKSKNKTRRGLSGSVGTNTCYATNPIDRCWRCRADWAENRQRLANCAKGFGRKAYGGGKKSEIYVVTDSSDEDMENPKPGTLRWGVIQEKPLWIIFSSDMTIVLKQELIVTSWKTIDGRGARVEIAHGAGITIQFVSNVIIHGLHIHHIQSENGGIIRDSVIHEGLRTQSDGDGITIFGASNVWIDHMTMSHGADGLVDVIYGSTGVTISNSYFTEHDKVILCGADKRHTMDAFMQVTIAFNHFGHKCKQRMPRVRYGFVHVVNNDYTEWGISAIGGSDHPTIISQGNRYTANPDIGPKEVTHRDYAAEWEWKSWNWTTEGDVFRNGAFFRKSGVRSSLELTKNYSRFDVFRAKPGTFVTRLTRFVGALSCKVGEPC